MLQNIIIYPLLWVRQHLGFNDVRMLNDASHNRNRDLEIVSRGG
jgi:hypothetical protein